MIALDGSFLVNYPINGKIVQYDYSGAALRDYAVSSGVGDGCIAVYDGVMAALDTVRFEIIMFDLATGEQTDVIEFAGQNIIYNPGVNSIETALSFNGDGLAIACGDGIYVYDGQGFAKLTGG
ncbi:MAG: hypothetical protein LBS19_09665 [Clostridiales bacterium]|nr:hypothetical protein [Clostridiales bacterium]